MHAKASSFKRKASMIMKQWSARFLVLASARLLVAAMAILLSFSLPGQQTAQPAPAANAANPPASMSWTAAQDHQNMMDQLGIKALRPGPSGDETRPDHANYRSEEHTSELQSLRH